MLGPPHLCAPPTGPALIPPRFLHPRLLTCVRAQPHSHSVFPCSLRSAAFVRPILLVFWYIATGVSVPLADEPPPSLIVSAPGLPVLAVVSPSLVSRALSVLVSIPVVGARTLLAPSALPSGRRRSLSLYALLLPHSSFRRMCRTLLRPNIHLGRNLIRVALLKCCEGVQSARESSLVCAR